MKDRYILLDKKPVKENNVFRWAEWFDKNKQSMVVAKDYLENKTVEISTIFLGWDEGSEFSQGQPVVFETMVFGGKHNLYQRRYKTWEQAEQGHKQIVEAYLKGELE